MILTRKVNETIKDQLCPNESEARLAAMSNQSRNGTSGGNRVRSNLATEEKLAVAVRGENEEQLDDISAIVTAESLNPIIGKLVSTNR